MSYADDYAVCLQPGQLINLPYLRQVWTERSCPGAIGVYMSVDSSGTQAINYSVPLGYNAAGAAQVREDTWSLINQFNNTNGGDQFRNPVAESRTFRDQLVNYCRDSRTPGACDTWLKQFCADYDRQAVINDSFLTEVCGCYVPPDPAILDYSNQSVTAPVGCSNGGCSDSSNPCDTPGAACDSLCRNATTVKRVCLSTGEPFTCPQDVCVIDQAAVVTSNSRIGQATFNSICSGCQDGCVCIVEVDSDIPVDINQYCGDQSVCLQVVNGVSTEVPCAEVPAPTTAELTRRLQTTRWGLLPLLVLGVVVLIIVGLLILSRWS